MVWARRKTTVALACASSMVLALAACGDDSSSRGQVSLVDARTWAGTTVLSVSTASCNGDPEVEIITQDPQEVRLVATARSGGEDCLDGVVVCLTDPLEVRSLVDGTTGTRVPVERLTGSPPESCSR